MILCYITDRSQFPGSEGDRQARLLERVGEAAGCGIDLIQLRERDLCGRDLENQAREVIQSIRQHGQATRLLINSRTDIALSAGADGVHLRSQDVSAEEVRTIWRRAGATQEPVISAACHTQNEVSEAARASVKFAVFAPVFGKRDSPQIQAAGLDALRTAARQEIKVLALGGITLENAALCVRAGAAGIAGIRLFQQGDLANTVQRLRAL